LRGGEGGVSLLPEEIAMAITITLEGDDEARVSLLVDSGAFGSANEAVRGSLRLALRELPEVRAFWATIDASIADVEAGNFFSVDEVFDELEARYKVASEEPEPA
jgi:Arc/MetJ-type ribon-helix-helix transcriptional regulator